MVGIGPGDLAEMSGRAIKALTDAEVLVGYKTYIKLLTPFIKDGKERRIITGVMGKEVERAELALKEARKGQNVALVSSGDAGVYGMAGLVLEMTAFDTYEVKIDIIPGITAATSGAALLGAPLSNDFAVISLSDLLTPLEIILKRVEACVAADMVLALYNPVSRNRKKPLAKSWEIIKKYHEADVPVGIVKKIARQGEETKITTVDAFQMEDADMFSTIIVGNSHTRVLGKYMVTSRGYRL